jgi:hypothetical protein
MISVPLTLAWDDEVGVVAHDRVAREIDQCVGEQGGEHGSEPESGELSARTAGIDA